MSSAQNTAIAKICAVCGQDVAGRPRTKDPTGRYFCAACYEQLRHTKKTATGNAETSAAGPIPGVEINGPSTDKDPQMNSFGSLWDGKLWSRPEVRQYIRKTNWLLVCAIFTGIFLPPIGIPLQIICMRRLLRLADRPTQWRWIIPAALPLVGLIPVKLMADRAGKVVHKPLDKIKPFDPEQQWQYRKLLVTQWSGSIIFFVPWFVGKLAGDSLYDNTPWLCVFGAAAVAGFIIFFYANIRSAPYRKVLRQAGGQRIWFSDGSDVERDWNRKELNRTPTFTQGA